MVRLFVGGLPPDVTEKDLISRFTPFGAVSSCELLPPKAGHLPQVSFQQILASQTACLRKNQPRSAALDAAFRGIAYIDIEPKDAAALQKCLRAYNHSKWRGHEMRVEPAQPSYLQRLQKEWEADVEAEGK